MAYRIVLGDYTYSSWSLRGWLMLERFGLPWSIRFLSFGDGPVPDQAPEIAPSRLVPALICEDGTVIWDTLAIAEELASRHPDAGHWPADPAARASARSITAEMHSGFGALRDQCPMHLQAAYSDFVPSDATRADVARIEELWGWAKGRFGSDGSPWLFGAYSAADAFYAPIAARFASYGLSDTDAARAYVAAHLADPAFRRWRAMGKAKGIVLDRYRRDYTMTDWPGPQPLPARAVDTGTPENDACPYSGKPVTHLLETGGRIFGFCNAFCRDKTVADPEAWPKFMALL